MGWGQIGGGLFGEGFRETALSHDNGQQWSHGSNMTNETAFLEVTIYDEDPNKKAEFLGKVAIPLLKIKNGEKRWYALKDRKFRKRAKGQILMELEVEFNAVRASVRTFNPREIKFIPAQSKFKRQLFMRSVNRIKEFGTAAAEGGAFIKSCWNWESPPRSISSYLAFVVLVYFFQLYMLPLCLLLLFVKGALFRAVAGTFQRKEDTDEYCDTDEDDDAGDDKVHTHLSQSTPHYSPALIVAGRQG